MSRTPSFGPPPRGGTFRPQLEALEDRFAPGSLFTGLDGWDERHELLAVAQVAAGANRTTSPVVEFLNPTVVRGESTITRTDNGISVKLQVSDKVSPGVYTFWFAVINPGASGPVAGRVAGHVVGNGGNLNFTAHLNEGEVLSGHPIFPSGTLLDAQRAEIRAVVRSHGPAEPGRIHEQTHTFEPTRAFNFLLSVHAAPAP